MNISKKILSLVTSLVLLFTMIPTTTFFVTKAANIDDVPELPSSAVAVLDEVGISKQIVQHSHYTINNILSTTVYKEYDNASGTRHFEATNLSEASYIEFDIYYEKYDELVTKLNANNVKLKLYFSTKNWWTQEAYINDLISYVGEVDSKGWRHVKIPKSAFEGAMNWSSVICWAITQNGGTQFTVGEELCSEPLKIVNVCGTNVKTEYAPELPENTVAVLDKVGISKQIVQFQHYTINNILSTTVYNGYDSASGSRHFEATNLSEASYIEFDIYYEKYDELVTKLNANNVKLKLYFSTKNWWTQEAYINDLISYVGEVDSKGWRHVKIPKSAFEGAMNWSSVICWAITQNGGTQFTVGEELCSVPLKIVNVCGTNVKTDYAPELPENTVAVLDKVGISKQIVQFQHYTINNILSTTVYNGYDNASGTRHFEATDMSNTSYIEFDIFYEKYDLLVEKLNANNVKLRLYFSSNNWWTKGAYIDDLISYVGEADSNGWRHVKIPKSAFAGTMDWSSVVCWAIEQNGGTNFTVGEELCSVPLKIVNVCGTSVGLDIAPEYPSDAVVELWKEGTKENWGAYNIIKGYKWFDTAIDISSAENIEFDIYIEDYEAFLAADDSHWSFFKIANSNWNEPYAAYSFRNQIVKDGWNHIVIEDFQTKIDQKAGIVDFTAIKQLGIVFWTNTGDANPISGTVMRIANICGTYKEIEHVPEYPSDAIVEIWKEGTKENWGAYNIIKCYKWYDTAIDISSAEIIEFDIYIKDYEAFLAADDNHWSFFKIANSDWGGQYAAYSFRNQIVKDGWNHIVIKDFKTKISQKAGTIDFAAIKQIGIVFWANNSDTNPISSTSMRIANVCGTIDESNQIPALPDNVLAQVGSSEKGTDTVGNTVGAYFHYTLDRIYKAKLDPVDLSQTPIIEFDIYISDYDKFLAAENDPTDGMKSKLAFAISSTAPELWGQYSKSYCYFNSQINLADYVTHSGWNHVVVGQAEFEKYNHGVDWSSVTGYMIYYRNSSNFAPYVNANSDLYVKVANIVNTGVVANIPEDKPTDIRPDKDAVYISSIEGISDDNGVWNALTASITNKYKTAGEASLHNKITYKSKLEETNMGYIFDATADLSDLKILKVDFFVDLPQYLTRPTNKIEVLICNNRFGKEDYYSWYMDLTNIKQGWNEISLDFQDAKAVGNPDLKKAKLVMFRFTELGLLAEDFEELVYGIDNLRYISSTGNTVLRVEGLDDMSDSIIEQETDNDSTIEQEALENEDVSEKVETVVNKTGKVKYNKIVERTIITDWLYAGIIVGAVAAVCSAVVILFIIIHRKKNKKV